MIAVNEKGGDVFHFACFKGVAEHERENRRQNEKQKEDAPVAINMEELFVSHTENGADRLAVHDVLL